MVPLLVISVEPQKGQCRNVFFLTYILRTGNVLTRYVVYENVHMCR